MRTGLEVVAQLLFGLECRDDGADHGGGMLSAKHRFGAEMSSGEEDQGPK